MTSKDKIVCHMGRDMKVHAAQRAATRPHPRRRLWPLAISLPRDRRHTRRPSRANRVLVHAYVRAPCAQKHARAVVSSYRSFTIIYGNDTLTVCYFHSVKLFIDYYLDVSIESGISGKSLEIVNFYVHIYKLRFIRERFAMNQVHA